MKKEMTEKQKNARIRNFNKFRIRGALAVTVGLVGEYSGISPREQDLLMQISGKLNTILANWKKETIKVTW